MGAVQAAQTEGLVEDDGRAVAGIFTFIETSYDRRLLRKHANWGCLTPHETRRRHEQTGPEHALALVHKDNPDSFQRLVAMLGRTQPRRPPLPAVEEISAA